MSTQETEQVVSAYLTALSGGDFASYFAEDVLWITMENGDQVRGRQEVTDYIIALHTQLFAASPELVNVAYGNGLAILEAVFVGTHTGAFGDIPATGVKVRLPYCVAYTIADSKITELRAYLSMLALQQHLTGGATGTPDH